MSIELFIQGDRMSTDPMTHESRYILEPDHSLHIAVNGQALPRTYPPFVKYLTRSQMLAFTQLIRRHQLTNASSTKTVAPNSSATPAGPESVRYHLTLSAWGKTNHLVTTPEASPAVKALARLFIEAGEVQPSGQVKPPPPAFLFHSPTAVESP